jgi:hypothetical protein
MRILVKIMEPLMIQPKKGKGSVDSGEVVKQDSLCSSGWMQGHKRLASLVQPMARSYLKQRS